MLVWISRTCIEQLHLFIQHFGWSVYRGIRCVLVFVISIQVWRKFWEDSRRNFQSYVIKPAQQIGYAEPLMGLVLIGLDLICLDLNSHVFVQISK